MSKTVTSPIVLIQPNTVDFKSIRKMRSAGYLVIETPDITALRMVSPPQMLPMATIAAIALETVLDGKVCALDIREEFRRRVTANAIKVAEGKELEAKEKRIHPLSRITSDASPA